MVLTKDYLRYSLYGSCNVVASSSTGVAALSDTTCAVAACEYVNVYNIKTAQKIHEISGSDRSVCAFKFSNTRRYVAVGYDDGIVRLFDCRDNDYSSFITFAGHKTGVNCMAFSDDGLLLATGGKDSSVIVWDVVNESGLFKLFGHKSTITHLQFTHDTRFLLSSSKDSFMKFWSLDTQSCFFTLTESHSEIYTFSLLRDDTLLVVGSSELELLVFELHWFDREEKKEVGEESSSKVSKIDSTATDDAQENKIVRCIKRGKLIRHSKGRSLNLSVSPDEKILACVGSSHVIDFFRVFNPEESEKRVAKKIRKSRKRLIQSEGDQTVTEGDIQKDITILITRIGEYQPVSKVKAVNFSPKTKQSGQDMRQYNMFVLYANNTVYSETVKVDLKSNEVECSMLANLNQLGHRLDVRCLAMAESGYGFVSGSADSAIVWNLQSLRISHFLTDDDLKDITACLFVTGDKYVLLATKDGHIFLFELSTNEVVDVVKKAHDGAIWQLVTSPDRKGFVSCGVDKKVLYWMYELVSEGIRKRLAIRQAKLLELPDEVLCEAVSSDSRFLAVGLLDNTARVYFADTFKFFVSLYGHSLPVTAIHISHDSKLVATGSADKTVKIWGLDFGDCHKTFLAHDDIVTSVLFSPEEHLLWSASKDGMLKQWDADKFERVQVLSLHSADIRALTQTSNGKFVVSASHDQSIRVWELTEEMIVLQNEEEIEREKEYEKRLAELEDVVPGEEQNAETGLAARKSIMSIKSAEDIIQAVEIVRYENVNSDDVKHEKHPLIKYYESASLSHFIIDVIQRISSSHLEKCLLMIPFNFVTDIMKALGDCVAKHYKAELASRVLLFLIKIHHRHVIRSVDLLPILENLRKTVPRGIADLRDVCGFNMAALKLLKKEVEEQSEVKLFADVSELGKKSKKSRKAKVKAFI